MSIAKRILQSTTTQIIVSHLLAWYIRLVMATSDIHKHINPQAAPYIDGKKNGVFLFWHGRMMLLPAFMPANHTMHVLISFHRDGQIIAEVMRRFNMAIVHGSSSRGGTTAVKSLIRHIRNGHNVAITPDGPRGPHEIVKKGALTTARHTDSPLIPVAISSNRHKRMKSWDRFMLAYPFSRIVFCVGAPIHVCKETAQNNQEQLLSRIQHTMDTITQHADQLARHPRSNQLPPANT